MADTRYWILDGRDGSFVNMVKLDNLVYQVACFVGLMRNSYCVLRIAYCVVHCSWFMAHWLIDWAD